MKNSISLLVIFCLLTSCASTSKFTDSSQNNISITTKRDGSTFEKAIIINKNTDKAGIDAEYEWLRQNYPGYKFNGQILTQKNRVPYDIINIITADGQSKSIYFNISRFFPRF
jgi:predicted Zn-dependent protease